MLNCEVERGDISLNANFQPEHEVSGIIGLSGKMSGTVVISLERNVAISATGALLGEVPESIDTNVIDTVGELTNMIAGQAKGGLEQFDMALALPTVITGKNHIISFGSVAQTICIPYSCKWGDLTVEVGIAENSSSN